MPRMVFLSSSHWILSIFSPRISTYCGNTLRTDVVAVVAGNAILAEVVTWPLKQLRLNDMTLAVFGCGEGEGALPAASPPAEDPGASSNRSGRSLSKRVPVSS